MLAGFVLGPLADVTIDDSLTRRQLIAAGTSLTALWAAGCSASEAPPDPAATRTVTDLAGRSVTIPVNPQRIVSLDPNRITADLVALGFAPIGATTNPTNPDGGFAPTLGAAADGMESLGATGEANLEQVAALQPDLIFHATAYQAIPVETLAAIAPVITYEYPPTGLLAPLTWLGELLGVEDRATALKTDLTTTIDQQKDAIGLTGRRVSLVNLGNYEATTTLSLGGSGTNIGELAELLGAVVVPEDVAGKALEGEFVDVALELAPSTLSGTEWIIASYYGGNEDNEQRYRAAAAHPVWRSVPAVKAGRVAYLNVQESYGTTGIDGIRAALEDLASQTASR